MEKLWLKIKQHPIVTVLVILLLLLGVPLLINASYKCKYPILITTWGAEDVLSYYGSALSLIGTLIVSAFVLEQTYSLNKRDREEQKRNYKRPYLSIDKVLHNKNEIPFVRNSWEFNCDKLGHVKINIKNDGDGIAKKCFYKDYFCREDRDRKEDRMNIDIAAGETHLFSFSLNKNKEKYDITYENILDQSYKKIIGVRITEEYNEPEEDNDDIKSFYKVRIFNID